MLHCWTAIVAPRPIDSVDPRVASSGVIRTRVEVGPAFTLCASGLHSLGTPAARQMLAHNPAAVKSRWTEGSTTKPIRNEITVRTHSQTTLQRNQPLLHEKTPSPPM